MTLAIGHSQGELAVLDLLRARKPPFSPEQVTAEFAADCRRYGIHEIGGDRYAGDWPGEQFRKHSIHYRVADRPKSEIYQSCLPMLNSGRVELLDDKALRQQFVALERKTARSGRDSIDHRPGSHDDIVNAAAGALIQCAHSEPLGADMFLQVKRAEGFASSGGGYHTETFEDWTRTRDGDRTLWQQMPEEKKQ
jgi:hypothetical protein